MGASRLIRRRCRFRQYFETAWTTELLPMCVRPGRNRTLHPRTLSLRRLSWTLFVVGRGSRTVFGVACGRCRQSPKMSDWPCESSISGSCPSLAAGSGGPLPCGTFVFINPLFGCWMRISQHDLPSFGLCVVVWRVWHSTAPSPIPGMDWCTGVGRPVGDGTRKVAAFVVSGPGYGCGCSAPSGCLFDGNELIWMSWISIPSHCKVRHPKFWN